uniref:Nucleotide-diphospho-sugar transferase domain-containing protein n=1 Tax=viral metagenome TaxID=1070528 RepID=A0A6C0D4E5_9ZZZZ
MTKVVFSTCWYEFKGKFDKETYYQWMDTLLTNVNNYYLVIYTDKTSANNLLKYCNHPRIKLVMKEPEDFYMYKYKNEWEHNHNKNVLLNDKTDWRVNMLWSEKIFFVKDTIDKQYFCDTSDTDLFYGWIDIGYFRETYLRNDSELLKKWPNYDTIAKLDKTKIYYSLVNHNDQFLDYLNSIIADKNTKGLPNQEIPPYQVSIGGGFFITALPNIGWWATTYETKLKLYFDNKYLVKDDQIIIADCVFSDINRFFLIREYNPIYDFWFVFARYFA